MIARTENRRGFSKSEFLVVLGAAAVLLSAVLAGLWRYDLYRRETQVQRDMRFIESACVRFFNEYYIWPTMYTGTGKDVRYGSSISNAEIVAALEGRAGGGNPEHRTNPNRINFLQTGLLDYQSMLSRDGEWVDPWGTPYQVVFDTDLDGHCVVDDSLYGRQPDQEFLIWSCGPDRISDTFDDLLGWRRRVEVELDVQGTYERFN